MKTVCDLNGIWKFSPTFDQKPTNNHNVIASRIPMYALPDLKRSDWENVPVPGVWQRYAERYSVYEGVCWFYREFDLQDVCDDSFVNLVFKGVNYKADVYINGKYAGCHESAYTEFSLDISGLVQPGKNAIAVQVDNRPTVVKWPNDWGYGVYGGIHRDVFVEVYNGNYLSDISLTPEYDVEHKQGVLSITGNAKGVSAFTVSMADRQTVVECCGGVFTAELRYDNLTPWTPENPVLYSVSLTAQDAVYKSCNIGFRHAEFRDNQFLLNGEPAIFNGACYVYDSPKYGLVMAKDQLTEDLRKMKEANVNAIRTHYPMSDAFYELCDEMGFMVWIEPNIYCSKPFAEDVNTVFKQEDFVSVAVSMTEEMIHGERQFASVVIYGIGNECNLEHPEALPFFETIAQTVRRTDPTRSVGYAALYDLVGNIAHLVDVMGINSYYAWYNINFMDESEDGTVCEADVSQLHELLDNIRKKLPQGMPFLLTEFGADSQPKNISPTCALWSENYHAKVVSSYIEAAHARKDVVGTFVFCFTDYLDPSKPKNGRWNEHNLKGMLSYDRQYKLPYYALQEAYAK